MQKFCKKFAQVKKKQYLCATFPMIAMLLRFAEEIRSVVGMGYRRGVYGLSSCSLLMQDGERMRIDRVGQWLATAVVSKNIRYWSHSSVG